MVDFLIKKGANVNVRNEQNNGIQPIFIAANNGSFHSEIIFFLHLNNF